MNALNIGEPAPAFRATAVGGSYGLGTELALADLIGQTVILYFYPKDDTPGCTSQACGLRDHWHLLSQHAAVFGISPDSSEKHRRFIDKHQLPFPLIVDDEKAIAQAYGVWVEKSMYGKKYMGVERSTFIVGPDGQLAAIFRKVKPAEHVDKLLAHLTRKA